MKGPTMGRIQDRSEALTTLSAVQRAQKLAWAGFIAGVAVNTISQPQIDGLVACQLAYDNALIAANAALRSAEAP